MFKLGDRVLTYNGKIGTIIDIKVNYYYVYCEEDLSYNIYKENEIVLDEKYYRTLIYDRKRKGKK